MNAPRRREYAKLNNGAYSLHANIFSMASRHPSNTRRRPSMYGPDESPARSSLAPSRCSWRRRQLRRGRPGGLNSDIFRSYVAIGNSITRLAGGGSTTPARVSRLLAIR